MRNITEFLIYSHTPTLEQTLVCLPNSLVTTYYPENAFFDGRFDDYLISRSQCTNKCSQFHRNRIILFVYWRHNKRMSTNPTRDFVRKFMSFTSREVRIGKSELKSEGPFFPNTDRLRLVNNTFFPLNLTKFFTNKPEWFSEGL